MKAKIIPKLMREANLHFGIWMTENKPTDAEISSTIHLNNNLILGIFITGESDKKRHVSLEDNCITNIVNINSIKTNVPVST